MQLSFKGPQAAAIQACNMLSMESKFGTIFKNFKYIRN